MERQPQVPLLDAPEVGVIAHVRGIQARLEGAYLTVLPFPVIWMTTPPACRSTHCFGEVRRTQTHRQPGCHEVATGRTVA